MPIIFNKPITNDSVANNQSVEQPKIPLVPLENVSLVTKTRYDKDHHVLIVDGKERKISKQSQYILDMLSLDDK